MRDFQNVFSSFKQLLTAGNIIKISMRMLACINREITYHNIRTAYLSLKLGKSYNFKEGGNLQTLIVLALYHTIGFYREDFHFSYNPYDPNPDFFSNSIEVNSRYAFSDYYLEDMTPLKDAASALEHFTEPLTSAEAASYIGDYKKIIYFCAQISDYFKKNPDKPFPKDISEISQSPLDTELVALFNQLNKDDSIYNAIKDNTAEEVLQEAVTLSKFTDQESLQLQKLLVYFLDFKSTYTVSHSINTACYSLSLGLRCNLSTDELNELFTSALLHDIGKIATPQRILEAPGKLSPEDMGIMRHHVNHSRRILRDYTPQNIIDNAYRHHEKLNGNGYPNHLLGDSLTKIQRIITVADITSALNDSRSYKAEFSVEKIYSIIGEMTEKGELDTSISTFILKNFEEISAEQQELLKILRVDFSNILSRYNNFIITSDDVEEIEEMDDIVEDLEEL